MDDRPLTNPKRRKLAAQVCRLVLEVVLCAGAVDVGDVKGRRRAETRIYHHREHALQPGRADCAARRSDRVGQQGSVSPHGGPDTQVFDSRSIEPNASWTYVASKAGDYAYTCSFHPTMKARPLSCKKPLVRAVEAHSPDHEGMPHYCAVNILRPAEQSRRPPDA